MNKNSTTLQSNGLLDKWSLASHLINHLITDNYDNPVMKYNTEPNLTCTNVSFFCCLILSPSERGRRTIGCGRQAVQRERHPACRLQAIYNGEGGEAKQSGEAVKICAVGPPSASSYSRLSSHLCMWSVCAGEREPAGRNCRHHRVHWIQLCK